MVRVKVTRLRTDGDCPSIDRFVLSVGDANNQHVNVCMAMNARVIQAHQTRIILWLDLTAHQETTDITGPADEMDQLLHEIREWMSA